MTQIHEKEFRRFLEGVEWHGRPTQSVNSLCIVRLVGGMTIGTVEVNGTVFMTTGDSRMRCIRRSQMHFLH